MTSGYYATATFTFTGTGFDIISRTDNTSGFITVDVTNAKQNGGSRGYVVNNYYQTTESITEICEVPVMKVSSLPSSLRNFCLLIHFTSETVMNHANYKRIPLFGQGQKFHSVRQPRCISTKKMVYCLRKDVIEDG